jgi:hypothetical protein
MLLGYLLVIVIAACVASATAPDINLGKIARLGGAL